MNKDFTGCKPLWLFVQCEQKLRLQARTQSLFFKNILIQFDRSNI